MKTLIRSVLYSTVLLAASVALAVPSMKVTVFSAGGKVAFQGATDSSGTFATAALPRGRYVVQFNSKSSAAMKGQNYALVVSAGDKKVVADTVAGEKFLGGGVAMRIEVRSGLNLTGQVASGLITRIDPKTGQKLIWLKPGLGTNLPGRWVPQDSPSLVVANRQREISRDDLRKRQDHGDVSAGATLEFIPPGAR